MSAPPSPTEVKADTGATGHFLAASQTNLTKKPISHSNQPISVLLPNGNIMESIGTTQLPIPSLPKLATKAHIFNSLASGSLLSIGKICDQQCTAIFNKTKVSIHKNSDITISTSAPPLLTGTRNSPSQPLWTIKLPSSPLPVANSVLHNPSIRNRVAFYHAALFSPTIDTWTKSVRKGHMSSWPELTVKQITKYAPNSLATIKGHQHAIRANIQSTKKTNSRTLPLTYAAVAAAAAEIKLEPPPARTNHIFIACQDITGRAFSDQTGQFVCPSTAGNKYIFILYDYDSNSIHARPIPSKTKHSLKKAYKSIIDDLTMRGFKPKLQKLDNEVSDIMKEYLTQEHIEYQLTPVGLHRRNLAERAVQTFKEHFISGLCSTHPEFPLVLWCKLIPQAVLTLNLLRSSRVNPQLSAHAQLYGHFDYTKTPLAPPGMKVVVHERADDRGTWSPHGIDGWYVGPAMNHYRCHRVWITSTSSERVSDTVSWIPHGIKLPTASDNDLIIAATNDLTQAIIQAQQPNNSTFLSQQSRHTLQTLSNIFSKDTNNRTANTDPIKNTTNLPRVLKPNQLPTIPPPRVPTANPSQPSPLPSKATTTNDYLKLSTIRKLARKTNKKKKSQSPAPPQPPKTTTTKKSQSPASPISTPPTPTNARRKSNRLRRQTPIYSANAVLDDATGKLLEYKDLLKGPSRDKWYDGCSKEFARLCNGRKKDDTKGTNTIFFKKPSQLPRNKKATYLRIVANYRPQKEDPYRIRFTVGGNLINYPGETYTPTADLTTAKLLINSVISTKGARFMCIDLSNFYLRTPLASPSEYEYMHIPLWAIPDDIRKEYNIDSLAENGKVLAEIRTGMYGLPQAGRLAYIKLLKHLDDDGYRPTGRTPGLFKHETRPVLFNLVVDDFGVKFTGKENAEHLITTLKKHYDVTIDREGSIFCGIHLKWNYPKRTVKLGMPGYARKGNKRFKQFRTSIQHSPHKWNRPMYGKYVQYADAIDKNNKLTPAQKQLCQEIVGVYLYYARAIDNTMLVAIGAIATAMSTASWADLRQRLQQFLSYAATHPNAEIQYIASDMHLWIHSDASYLNEPKARSRGGGYFFLSDKPKLPIGPTDPAPPLNAPILVNSKVIPNVMSSAQESETGTGYINAKDAVPLRTALHEMGHPQGPTPIQFDNLCATGIINDTVTQRRSKAMDMRFYWLRDRVAQKQFYVFWRRGNTNLADYFTKHFPASHHKNVRATYVLNCMITYGKLKSWTRQSNGTARVC